MTNKLTIHKISEEIKAVELENEMIIKKYNSTALQAALNWLRATFKYIEISDKAILVLAEQTHYPFCKKRVFEIRNDLAICTTYPFKLLENKEQFYTIVENYEFN